MKRTKNRFFAFSIVLALIIPSYVSFAAGEETITSEELMKQLEETVKLNSEKMAKLKPEIDAASEKLKTMVQDSVDKGFVRMDEFSKNFEEISKETEMKVKEFLTSEEYEKFKNYLTKIDKETLQEAQNKIVQDLSELLELSEEQIRELKPVIEENIHNMTEMLSTFAQDGAKSWAEVASKYDEMSKELRQKLKDILDSSQLESSISINRRSEASCSRSL